MLLKGSINDPHVEIKDSEKGYTYKPSIDVTLTSISRLYLKETFAIILTGMGYDGKNGCQILWGSSAEIWVQNKKSSAIYGMPQAIVKAGLTEKVFDINELGTRLSELK